MRGLDRRERLPVIHALVQAQFVDPHFVLVLRVDGHVVEIKRPRAQALAVVHERPAFAGVGRLVQAALRAECLDHGIEHVGIAARDVDVDLPDEIIGQASGDLLPRVATIGRLVDAALRGRAATDNVPALAESAIHRRVDDIGIVGIDFDIAPARLVVHKERALPGLAAVGGLEDATLVVRPEGRPQCGQPHRVRGVGMHLDAADLARVLEPHELPGLPGIRRLVDTAPDDDVRADGGAARADPHVIRIRRRHVDRADRAGRDLSV